MERRITSLETILFQRRADAPSRRIDFSMLSDDELEELCVMAEARQPSLLDPTGHGALTLAQHARLVELAAKIEGGSAQPIQGGSM